MGKHCRIGVSGQRAKEGLLRVETWSEQGAWCIKRKGGVKDEEGGVVFPDGSKRRRNKTVQDAVCCPRVPENTKNI